MQVLIKFLTVRNLITSSRSTTLPSATGESIPFPARPVRRTRGARLGPQDQPPRGRIGGGAEPPQRASSGAAGATGASPTVALRAFHAPHGSLAPARPVRRTRGARLGPQDQPQRGRIGGRAEPPQHLSPGATARSAGMRAVQTPQPAFCII